MSRADGYEELPAGETGGPGMGWPLPPVASKGLTAAPPRPPATAATAATAHCPPSAAEAPQQQQAPPLQPPGPTFTQPPAGISQPQPPPVMGVPAYPQRQQQQPQQQHRLDQLPPFPQHLAELPSAMDEWDAAAVTMSVWLGCSVATLVLGLLSLSSLAVAAGVCGTVGASTHRCASCRAGATDLGTAVRRIHLLAVVAASISGVVGALGLLVSFGLSATWVLPPPPLCRCRCCPHVLLQQLPFCCLAHLLPQCRTAPWRDRCRACWPGWAPLP